MYISLIPWEGEGVGGCVSVGGGGWGGGGGVGVGGIPEIPFGRGAWTAS